MIQRKWAYQVFGRDFDFMRGDQDYDTPEDAAMAGIAEADDPELTSIEVCEITPVRLSELVSGASECVVENARDRLADTGYYDEDFLSRVDQAQLDDLDQRIHAVFKHWLKRYKHSTQAWTPGKTITFTFRIGLDDVVHDLARQATQPAETTA